MASKLEWPAFGTIVGFLIHALPALGMTLVTYCTFGFTRFAWLIAGVIAQDHDLFSVYVWVGRGLMLMATIVLFVFYFYICELLSKLAGVEIPKQKRKEK